MARRAIHPGEHPRAVGRGAARHHERLVLARAEHVEDRQLPAVDLEHAGVADLAAALRVERRGVELHVARAVAVGHPGDRLLLEVLVAREARRLPQPAHELGGAGAARGAGPPGRAGALLAHELLEAGLAHAHAVLGGDLERHLEREAVGVVELEGGRLVELPGREPPLQELEPGLERAPEPGLLRTDPLEDVLALVAQLGVAHVDVARQEGPLDAQAPTVLDRAAHHAAQDVAALLVGGHDAVGDEEGHRAGVVGEDGQRAVLGLGDRGELAPELHERRELVGLEDRLDPLQDRGHPVEAEARVDVLRGQRRQGPDRVLVELHEHEVPELEEALVLPARKVVRGAEGHAAVEVELRAGTAGAGRPRLPEVLRARQRDDPAGRDPDGLPGGDRLLVGAEAELLVAREDRDPDVLRAEAEAVQREVPGELDRPGLEVVAEGEVPEHLEERQVPGGGPDVLDVGRAEALLRGGQPRRRRALLTGEVGLERVHARGGEQDRGVVGRRHERARGPARMPPGLEEGQERLTDLVGAHAVIVA